MSAAAALPAAPDERGADRFDDRAGLVGREAELAAIARWLESARPALAEIEGEAGIGKTVLWDEGVRAARESGALVLSCSPVEIETTVSYGALAALLEPALALVGDAIDGPRLRALEGALRMREIATSSLDETAVALGALSALRVAAAQQPVVVAIDDAQWLDTSSRIALTYAIRNLGPGDDVAVLLTRRLGAGGGSLDLAGSAVAAGRELVLPAPLSLGAVHRMITARVGASLPRPKLVRVHDASRGNPLHALELARIVADADLHDLGLVVPPSLADTLRARIDGLTDPTRRLLLTVAASGEPSEELLATIAGAEQAEDALREATRHGVLALAGGTVRFTHPLLGSTVYGDASEIERSRAHARLAELAATSEARARHLALAGAGPSVDVAAALDEAAESASRRGARATAAALLEQAAQLTPSEDGDGRARRAVRAAWSHFLAGDPDTARPLLEEIATGTSPERHDALCRLGTLLDETRGGTSSLDAFRQALASSEPAIVARAHRGLAQALAYVGGVDEALDHADAAVAVGEEIDDPTHLVHALAMQALVRKIAGRPDWRAALARGLELESSVELPELDASPSAFDADTRRLDLDLDGAEVGYGCMLARAVDRGDVRTECWCHFGLAAVETAAGRLGTAAEHARELDELAEQTGLFRLPALRTSAHVSLLRGDVERARTLLSLVVSEAEDGGELYNLRCALQLQGLLELASGAPDSALPPLRRARELAEATAVGEPSMLTFLLDEVEAHALTGDGPSAAAVLMTFDRRCDPGGAAWARPLALRARGLVEAAAGELETARATLASAVDLEADVPLPLERARTRLALGRVLRRLQQRSLARVEIEEALARFEELGAPLWADLAREELARIGGRASSRFELTPTERRIAELVGEGLTNREVADAAFVTPKTVESALTRIYRKLGVRSRTELSRRLAEGA